MSDRLECAACHHVGYDVTYRMPAKYVSELRCIDGEACRERADNQRPMTFDDEGTVL